MNQQVSSAPLELKAVKPIKIPVFVSSLGLVF